MRLLSYIEKGLLVVALGALFISNSLAQSSWERLYGLPNRGELTYSITKTYDDGFLYGILVYYENSSKYGAWLLKTNANGYPLWSKFLFNPYYSFNINNLMEDIDGNIYATGKSQEFDLNGNPMLMKINACGEKLWCKYLSYPNTNYGKHLLVLPDGNILWQTYNATSNWPNEYSQLWWVDPNGFILSSEQIIPHAEYPNLIGPSFYDVIQTGDGGFLLCGYCWFPEDTTNPQGLAWLQHVLVKTDSAGNEKWVIPDTLNMELGGVLISVIEHNNFFYVSGYTREVEAIWHPYLGKYNQEGQLVDSYILHSDTLFSILFGLQENNDTLYHSSQCFYGAYDPTFTGVFSTDTSGTLFKHLQNKTGSPRHNAFVQTLDYKYLIGGYAPYDYEEFDELDAWAMKVNSNLEYDTLYSFPFVYDSLCPFPIPTDTIDCDCDLITGSRELTSEADQYTLSLFPNPSNNIVTIRFQDLRGSDDLTEKTVTLFDLFGRKAMELPILKETQINVTGLSSGIYILAVSRQGTVLAREKLIVM